MFKEFMIRSDESDALNELYPLDYDCNTPCGQISPNGMWYCTRADGHTEVHIAHRGDGKKNNKVVAVWDDVIN